MRSAALGMPVLPLVKVSKAGVPASASKIPSAAGCPAAEANRTAPGTKPAVTNLRGIRRTAPETSRSQWAFGIPTKASGGRREQQASIWALPTEGSRKSATPPRRKRPSNTTYNSFAIGQKSSTEWPGPKPCRRKSALTSQVARFNSAKVVMRGAPR